MVTVNGLLKYICGDKIDATEQVVNLGDLRYGVNLKHYHIMAGEANINEFNISHHLRATLLQWHRCGMCFYIESLCCCGIAVACASRSTLLQWHRCGLCFQSHVAAVVASLWLCFQSHVAVVASLWPVLLEPHCCSGIAVACASRATLLQWHRCGLCFQSNVAAVASLWPVLLEPRVAVVALLWPVLLEPRCCSGIALACTSRATLLQWHRSACLVLLRDFATNPL